MAKEVITTLHPEDDITTDLYPNIKEDNIPSTFKEKVSSEIANRTELIHKDASSSNTIVVGESDYALELVGTKVNARSGIYCDYINTINSGDDLYINNQGHGNIFLNGDTYVTDLKGSTLSFDYTTLDFEQVINVYFATNVNIEELKTDNINNTNGNAMVRYKSTENKVVLGGSTIPTTIMGSGDRPTYSKNGSDFTGNELALKSDVDSNWNLLMANLGIGRWANQTLVSFYWSSEPTVIDELINNYTSHIRYCAFTSFIGSNGSMYTGKNIRILPNLNSSKTGTTSWDYAFYNFQNECGINFNCDNEYLMSGYYFCYGANITSFNTGNGVLKIDFEQPYQMFSNCPNITEIGMLDLSKATNGNNGLQSCFNNCPNLKYIHLKEDSTVQCSFNLTSTGMEHDGLIEFLSHLTTPASTSDNVARLGTSKLALLTDDEKKVATDKGWILA